MTSQTSISAGAAGQSGDKKVSGGRMPAVVGVDPWSWRGDDNSGNMIHAAAARRMLSNYVEYKRPGEWTDLDLERLKSEHSHIVYVTANLIRLGVPSDHPSIEQLIASQVVLAKNIERAGLPVVVFRLGSQAALNGSDEFSVAPQTVRLLKVLSDHSRNIAVRGEFTAGVCSKLGVKNVEVVGCQSMFWHRSPQLSWKLSEPVSDGDAEIACNFTDASLEVNLIRQAMASGHDVIGQSDGDEEDLRQWSGAALPASIKFGWDVEVAIEKGLIDRQQYANWVQRHFYQFRRPQAWLDHMRRYSFSYGTRLHGNIAAMLAGVRAIWILHDMRLKEVLDHFRLPRIELKEAQNGVSLKALFDRADYSECIKAYPDRYRTLYEYVDSAGLPHSLPAPVAAIPPLSQGAAAFQGALAAV